MIQPKGKLFLLPAPLRPYGEKGWTCESVAQELPARAIDLLSRLSCFIVESERSALRLLSRFRNAESMKSMELRVFDENSNASMVQLMIEPMLQGIDCGLLSEAGLPCVADPGAIIVANAHEQGIQVIPVSGPSSIILALSASGLAAQRFYFLGYLPAEKEERKRTLKKIGNDCLHDMVTRIFIETPYRNDSIISDSISILPNELWFSAVIGIGSEEECIHSKPIHVWKTAPVPKVGKIPAVFLCGHKADIKPKNTK
jgi:16S rRNA (cytidine1402-2'-O)-methyltransferase